ncbi:MAG: hypothetical protein ABEJ40_03430 [Haloarculaceae archaeon]
MAGTTYLASTLVMGLIAIGVVAVVLRGRRWEQYTPQAAYDLDAGGPRRSGISRFASAPSTWTATFLLLAVGFLVGVTASFGGGISGPALIAALAVVTGAYFVGGVYLAMREHGRPSAQAAAGSVLVLGLLLAGAIAVKLLLGA